jgi:hypothetical protein
MNYCYICKEKIETKDLDKVFHFTLGNIIKGRFYASENKLFHIACIAPKDISVEDQIIECEYMS